MAMKRVASGGSITGIEASKRKACGGGERRNGENLGVSGNGENRIMA